MKPETYAYAFTTGSATWNAPIIVTCPIYDRGLSSPAFLQAQISELPLANPIINDRDRGAMSGHAFDNTYDLSDEQLQQLEEAEEAMLRADFGRAEKILLEMLEEDDECIPVLNNLAHLHGRHFSDFEKAVELYDKVLNLEPDNAWARDARRRYQRYVGRD